MIREHHAPSSFLHHRLYGTFGLALLASFYLFTGLTGHDPWRGDDIRYFGPIHSMLRAEGAVQAMVQEG